MVSIRQNLKKIDPKYPVAVIISLILGASIFGYGYLDYRYKKESLEQKVKSEEQLKVEQYLKKADYDNCMNEARDRLMIPWNKSCKDLGRKEDCSLPSDLADSYMDRRTKAEDACLERFGK